MNKLEEMIIKNIKYNITGLNTMQLAMEIKDYDIVERNIQMMIKVNKEAEEFLKEIFSEEDEPE